VANILRKAGYAKAPSRAAPTFLLKIMGLFDREVRGMLPLLGKKAAFDNSATFQAPRWRPTPIETSSREMAAALSR
jgi:dihydroflavonol-4-reductase